MMPLWQAEAPLILASKSAARRQLLGAAGVPIEVVAAEIDERAVEAPLRAAGASPAAIAAHLAAAKAADVSRQAPGRLVLGADQVLALDDDIFAKPANRDAARAQLLKLSGRPHALYAALCLMRDGETLFACVATARLTCRVLHPAFVDRYLAAAGDSVLASVGAYEAEGLGMHLFEKIDGEHTTILGLPLLPLLAFLREEGSLAG